jgi:two-component system capsular synthesis sensor histidine kinase RcsC
MLLLALGVDSISKIREFVECQQHAHSISKNLVDAQIKRTETFVRTSAIGAELSRKGNDQVDPSLIEKFHENGRKLLIRPALNMPAHLVMGAHGNPIDPEYLARYLVISEQLARISGANALANGRTNEGYFYSTDDNLITIVPAPSRLNGHGATELPGAQQLIQTLRIDPAALALEREKDSLPTRGTVRWLPPFLDPISGRRLVRIASPAFDKQRPFAVVVGEIEPGELLAPLDTNSFSGDFVVADSNGKLVAATSSIASDPLRLDSALRAATTVRPASQLQKNHDGVFTITDSLGDTGWTLTYVFSWNTIIAGVKARILIGSAVVAIILLTVWVGLVIVNRQVVKPIFDRSQRVFDSEDLSRRLVETASAGLALISAQTGESLLENAAMVRMAARLKTPGTTLSAEFVSRHASYLSASPSIGIKEVVRDEIALPTHEGTQVDLAVSMTPSRYQGYDVLVATFIDVTDKKRLEQGLRDAKHAADQANAAKSAFLANMSHEIRTPLHAILGNLELLAHTPLSTLQKNRLTTVQTSSNGLLEIISDILDFSKIEAGDISLEDIEFRIVDVIELALIIFSPIASAKGVELHGQFDPAISTVMRGDPTRLRQVVNNLLSNAIKFTEAGKVTLQVWVESNVAEPTHVSIAVRDTGIGISDTQQKTIFQAFAQSDASINRRFGGSGLGLTLCKHLVEAMGGTINVASEPNVGSTFTARLPLRTAANLVSDVPVFAGETITVLSSAEEWRHWIQPHLESWGLTVRVHSGPQSTSDSDLANSRVLMLFSDGQSWSADDENRAIELFKCVVDCRPNDPAQAVQSGGFFNVSSYSLTGIRAVLRQIFLPQPPSQAPVDVHASDRTEQTILRGARALRVLVAEDNPANQQLFLEQLAMLGCDSHVVSHGQAALDSLAASDWDVLLTDLSMPGMTGYELASAARSISPNLPVFAVTAHVTTEQHNHAMKVGMQFVLTKPLSLRKLYDALAVVARERRVQLNAPAEGNASPLGHKEISANVRASFNSSAISGLNALRDAQALRDINCAFSELHSIKGMLAIFREHELTRKCDRIEAALKKYGITALDKHLDDFESALRLVVRRQS